MNDGTRNGANRGPVVDGRSRDELLARLKRVAENYTEEWDPHSQDSGTTLMRIASRYGTEVVERLDSVPQKHQIAFLDALDFTRRPPQSAQVPLTFRTIEGIESNVVVPGGTQALGETDDDEAVIFELPQDGGFEATPASLDEVYSIDPDSDRLYDHHETVTSGDDEMATLFDGEDVQNRTCYLGHDNLLNVGPGSKITLHLLTNADEETIDECIEWEYYGYAQGTEPGDGTEGWHPLPQETSQETDADEDFQDMVESVGERVREVGSDVVEELDRPIELSFPVPGLFAETEIDEVESRWIRGRAKGDKEVYFDIEIEALTVSVQRDGDSPGMTPTHVFQNDVPLDLNKEQTGDREDQAKEGSTAGSGAVGAADSSQRDGGDVFPLGKIPQPPSTMYLSSEEAFTKNGSSIDIEFAPAEGDSKRETILVQGEGIGATTGSGTAWIVRDLEDLGQLREGDVIVTDVTDPTMEEDLEKAAAIVTEKGGRQSHAGMFAEEHGIPAVVGAEDAMEEIEDDQTINVDGELGQVTITEHLDDLDYEDKEGDEEEYGDPMGTAGEDDMVDRMRRMQQMPGPLGGPPELSWEYWNGDGWSRLPILRDETDNFTEDGTVTFIVPDDFEQTLVSGHEDYWIRARLISGDYSNLGYEMEGGERDELEMRADPPRFNDISILYGQNRKQFEHVLVDNNGSRDEVPKPEDEPRFFVPFEEPADDSQTLYLGFSDRLHDGPIKLHVPMRDDTYPRTFDPGIRWEYCPNPEDGDWVRLDAHDGTEGLTERGIVSLNFQEDTEAFRKFGAECHWVRARVTGDRFTPDDSGPPVRKRNGRTLERKPEDRARSEGSTTPPALEGIHPNTQWAHNAETVEDEILGSSDGTHSQDFTCYNTPVLEAEVWVDEVAALSRKEQRRLEDERPEDIERVPETGEPVEFWVRWEEVPDFLESEESSRHYRLDRSKGRITFGDGENGRIPPKGENNLRVTYETGGGSEGNVDEGTIEGLRTPISQVDEVTNLRPSDGGADVESMDTVVDRAPKKIKNRDRAVTPRDFEQVAMAASRELARAHCEPQRDDTGARNQGYVTLLIVPRERRKRPTPSTDLRARVLEAVRDRAPVSLVGPEQQRIIVRGPNYAEVSIETTVQTRGVESVSTLKGNIEEQLDDYFHPLTGNEDGDGWEFGEAPRLSQITSLIEGLTGVQTVREIVMSVGTRGERIKISDEAASPRISWDTLVSTGTHEITVDMAGDHEATVKVTGEDQ